MSKKSLDDLGELQRAVIEVVWELGQATVHQVRDKLGRRKKPAYTTILTAMQKLEKAGWLRHRAEGKSYVYLPTKSRQEAGVKSVRKFIKQVFDGDAVLMFQHLIRENALTDKELQKLRKMIDVRKKQTEK